MPKKAVLLLIGDHRSHGFDDPCVSAFSGIDFDRFHLSKSAASILLALLMLTAGLGHRPNEFDSRP